MIEAELPDGTILEFPDGTPDEVIQAVVKRQLAAGKAAQQPNPQQSMRDLASDQSMLQSGLISMGRGFTNVGRGFERMTGIDIPGIEQTSPAEEQAYSALQQQRPITTAVGQAVGEAAPFIPAAVAAGPLSFAPRVAIMAGIGAAETGIPSAGRGEDFGEILSDAGTGAAIAGGLEAALPVIGRVVGGAYRQLTGKTAQKVTDAQGNIIPEVRRTLEAAGVNVDDLKSQAVDLVQKAPKSPEEAARLARFQQQGMEYTPGDISGEFAQRAKEARLLEIQSDAAAPLRDIRTRQAAKIDDLKNRLAEGLGKADLSEIGDSVKASINQAEQIAYGKRKANYDALAEAAGYENGIPLPTTKIIDTVMDDRDFLGMVNALTDAERGQLNRMMVKYGIDDTPESVEAFTASAQPGILQKASTITPLTTKNAEDFNKSLNAMAGPNSSSALRGVISKLKSATDDGFEAIDDAIGSELMNLKKQARLSNIALKQDFSPQSLAGRLKGVKQDGITPIVEASNVYATLFRPGRTSTLEPLTRTLDILERTPEGKKSIGNLQSRLIMDVIDSGFNASNKVNNQVLFSGNAAKRYLEKLGEPEVEVLFRNNPEALKQFKDLLQTGVDITPSQKEVVKGSGSVILNMMNKVADMTLATKIGPVQGLMNAFNNLVRAGADEREIKKILAQRPELRKHAEFIARDLPAMGALLGVSYLASEENGENN